VETHLAVVVRAVVAQRVEAAHVAVVVTAVAVVMVAAVTAVAVVTVVAVTVVAVVENKYVRYLVGFERNECFAKECLSLLCEAAWSCNRKH
jgi:hypothetical protein